ncbi:SpoIIE family protein phosphatase [Halanaerobacter jeridensis]|uniref:PAS domain S-box-containing protein n=1 Tax=Halanaerobacter jeridensis TaxID=706427 RepID=A0A938XPL1_9FIRM|nr:SpoIIE family protein phosphatase [Halanaerobacter jeridensis]MBM7556752.1 PAS domain S-box-containing protein [Halanaerobacter jeridensis]
MKNISNKLELRSALDSLSSHIVILDSQGLILYSNRAWEEFAENNGLAPQQCGSGTNYLATLTNVEGEEKVKAVKAKTGIEKVMKGEKDLFTLEYPCHAPDKKRWFKMRVTPFEGENDQQVVIAHENITERKLQEQEMKETKDFTDNILDNLEELILYMDLDLTVQWANKGAQEYFNLDIEEMKDQFCYKKWGLDSPCNECPIIKSRTTQEREEKIMEKPDGSVWLMKAIPDVNQDGELEGFIEVSLDISKQKKAERKIKQVANKLEEQFEKAGKLHDQFLPSVMPKLDDISLGTYYAPADRLGGDFYNFINLEDKLIFYISDVSGHDLSGSMLNIFLKETINSYLISKNTPTSIISPGRVIEFINQQFVEESFPDDYFICLIIGVLDVDTKKIRFANAGIQFSPLLIQGADEVTTFSCGGLPISYASSELESSYQEVEFKMQRGDDLFLYTDGLIEQDNGSEIYGQERLKTILKEERQNFPQEIIKKINSNFDNFRKNIVVQDDVTYMLIQYDKS